MSQPKSLTKSVWKSLQHCHDTRIDPHACEHSKFPIVLEHDEEQGTASHCVTDVDGVASSRLAFGSKIIRCIDHSKASVTEFYKRVLWHEYGHAIETVNMFALVGGGDYEAGRASAMTDLANHKIPFRLFNLFEDVRLEGLQRRSRYGLSRFNWTKWQESIAAEPSYENFQPTAILYDMKMLENNREGMKALEKACIRKNQRWMFLTIRKRYFAKLAKLETNADSWRVMLSLLQRWVKEFGGNVGGFTNVLGDDAGSQGDVPEPTPEPDPEPPTGSGRATITGTGRMTIYINSKRLEK